MKYVKLIARPDTWFKAGTEVYDYGCHPPEDLRRITQKEWDEALVYGIICARGIRINEEGYEVSSLLGKIGEERWDGESCGCDEFDAEIVNEIK